jgi:hypothetical protein
MEALAREIQHLNYIGIRGQQVIQCVIYVEFLQLVNFQGKPII